MQYPRSSGILLHPTSLPGSYGIGDLGDAAYRFVDFLVATGQSIWQVLPLGPTSYGDSPYQALSAFAGNPLLISFDKMIEIGWLTPDDVADVPSFSNYVVDYGWVIQYHDKILTLAYQRFEERGTLEHKAAFHAWCSANVGWLDDFVLFVTLKDDNGGKAWVDWPEDQRLHRGDTMEAARSMYARRIAEHNFRQWVFSMQWMELKTYANNHGIRLVGDIPIFVAHDSSDVWGNRELFFLDAQGHPTVIAGVPPDYFSATGQRWGNPLYRWELLAEDNYDWWIHRLRAMRSLVDMIRIDHFRGFEAYWEVPGSEATAVNGRWVPGPGGKFFDAVQAALGELPIIAEDLGLITPEVNALRDQYHLPGMRVLQFGFTDRCEDSPHLPHNYVPNSVIYTGTHDNNTTVGWWQSASQGIQDCVRQYLGHPVTRPNWDLIRLAMMSVAHTAIFPLQDVLGFGSDTRMNTPGMPSGNWTWRFTGDWLDRKPIIDTLASMTRLYARWPEITPATAALADKP